MSLDGSLLQHPITAKAQEKIANLLWGTSKFQIQYLGPYFQYYTEQCRVAFQAHGTCIPVRTHQDIIDIAANITEGLPYSMIKGNLLERYNGLNKTISEDSLNACVDLTVRLLSMLDVGEFRNAFSGRRKLVWTSGSLRDFIQEIFSDKVQVDHDGIKLGSAFNVCNMVRVAGLKVELTSSLSDHLRLRDADKAVQIFHHASFLMGQRKSSLFPEGFVDETLATLALLFPQGDRNTERWYNKQDEPEELDHNVLRCGSARSQIEEYRYWHDRLVILKEAFDESKPSTISQWWNDRRDRTQWYTLWIAISFTVFFGLVQSIEGALQVYKSYYP